MSSGYIFVLSNPLYSEFVYVGQCVSPKTPQIRADELYSDGLLKPFTVEVAKQVASPEAKLNSLHKLLSKFGERPNLDRDFFKIPMEILMHLFDLVDGDVWTPKPPITEGAWIALMEKVGGIVKRENPKVNEFQLNKLKISIASSLKLRYGEAIEPTLEMVREAMEGVRKDGGVA
jgi:hypothetical protein